jgi:hypothetical protein
MSRLLNARTAIAAVGVALLFPGAAMAEERACTSTIGAVTLDNVRVPQNAKCTLNGTRLKGTLKVESNGSIVADDVVIIGNVQAENFRLVQVIDGSRIGGSVQLKKGGAATVADSQISGDVQSDESRGKLNVLRNKVGGSVQVIKNTGGVAITRNTIDGNLQCKENSPAPTGGKNIVGGNKEDQCSRL